MCVPVHGRVGVCGWVGVMQLQVQSAGHGADRVRVQTAGHGGRAALHNVRDSRAVHQVNSCVSTSIYGTLRTTWSWDAGKRHAGPKLLPKAYSYVRPQRT